MSTETPARIRWSDDRGFGCVGTIGPFMFQIVRVYLGPKWMLTADGMGRAFRDREPRIDDMDELKALAEEWLAEFVRSLGAVFPEPLTDDQRFQVSEARDLLARWDRERFTEDGYAAERTLADQVRALLAIVDQVAPDETAKEAGQ